MFTCSIDGNLCTPGQANISVMDHGLLYGDGIFEGLRFYSGRVFRLKEHLNRLSDSAAAIGLTLPMSLPEIATSINQTIEASELQDGYIRLIITRGMGALGLDPASCHDPRTIIIIDKLAIVSEEAARQGAKLIIASIRRLSADQIDPRIKSLNYLNQILAKQEANAANADEAIMLNQAGRVAEGSADNVFIVKRGILLTPHTSEGALDGITRAVVIEIAIKIGLQVKETQLSTYDLFTADECFLTGTGAELIPVASISGRRLPQDREIYESINREFKKLVRLPALTPQT